MAWGGLGGVHPKHSAPGYRVVAGIVWVKGGIERLRGLHVRHAACFIGIADENRRDAANGPTFEAGNRPRASADVVGRSTLEKWNRQNSRDCHRVDGDRYEPRVQIR